MKKEQTVCGRTFTERKEKDKHISVEEKLRSHCLDFSALPPLLKTHTHTHKAKLVAISQKEKKKSFLSLRSLKITQNFSFLKGRLNTSEKEERERTFIHLRLDMKIFRAIF